MTRLISLVCSIGLCVALLGCAQLQHSPPTATEERVEERANNRVSSALFKKRAANLANWHYESLPMCAAHEADLADFVLPETVDLWDRIREGFAFPDIVNRRVQQELNWYSRHPHYMQTVAQRGSRYLFHIVEELEKRQMPLEFALLPIVESAFDPFAYSHGRASGMWQVIPGTGKMLGLKQNWWYDGRRDVIASTNAALNYLEQLNKQFDGDWLLALAAYNSGAGTVNKAIRRNQQQGLPTDYWSLKLPRETQAYVPRLLAIKSLVEDPDSHNLALYSIPNEPFFAAVDVGAQIDLAQAAELAGMTMEEFYLLNPGYNRWATDPTGPHSLLIPYAALQDFEAKLAALPKQDRVTWERYRIQPGDSLSSIAAKYRTSVSALQSVNQLKRNAIRAGDTLLIPVATEGDNHYAYSASQRLQKKQSTGKGKRISYQVNAGDSLWSIGRRHGVTSQQIARWNAMAPGDPIKPGQKLVMWQQDASATAPQDSSPRVRKVAYTVRKGDSLARIANKFNLKINDIVSWNTVSPANYLQPGQSLTLFVDITQSP